MMPDFNMRDADKALNVKIDGMWAFVSKTLLELNDAHMIELADLTSRYLEGDKTLFEQIKNNPANLAMSNMTAKIREIHPALVLCVRDQPVMLLETARQKLLENFGMNVQAIMKRELIVSVLDQNAWPLIEKVFSRHNTCRYPNNWSIGMYLIPKENIPMLLSIKGTEISSESVQFCITENDNKYDVVIIIDVRVLGRFAQTQNDVYAIRETIRSYIIDCIGEYYLYRYMSGFTVIPNTAVIELNIPGENIKPWSEFHKTLQDLEKKITSAKTDKGVLIENVTKCNMCNAPSYHNLTIPLLEGYGCLSKGQYCAHCFNILSKIESGERPGAPDKK